MGNVVDDEVLNTARSLVEGDGSNDSQGHVYQNGDDYGGDESESVLLGLLHGVLGG